jgi:prepilin-type N-terminal cleavage/methylation domain-containing protein
MTHTTRGYTLLELIVAVGIFSLVMLAVSSAYLNLIRIDRETRATSDILNNLSFAMDSIAREIRTGQDYDCNTAQAGYQNCTATPGTSFSFTDSNGRSVTYSVTSSNQLVQTISGSTSELTDPRISIDSLVFYVRGTGNTTDGIQPQVTISVQGSVPTKGGNTVSATVQVGATQRFLDI